MKMVALIALLMTPTMAFAGGGSSPDCDSRTMLRCQSSDGNTLLDIMAYDCEDGMGEFTEIGLKINAPSGLFTVGRVGLINNTYWISTSTTGKRYALTPKQGKSVTVEVELLIKEGLRGDYKIIDAGTKQEIMSSNLICRE